MRVLFAATLFLSAALMFLVQPMIARMILPLLGGTTSVWNTCMVFFQFMLLAGYGYSHGLPERIGVRRHAWIHIGVLLLPFLVLPFSVAGRIPPITVNPVPWLLGILFVTVGLPFFALSTSAPLLQAWFSATGHREGRDPYFLYAASNLGSMLGLLSYPLVIEPALTLRDQSVFWMAGYAALVVLAGMCAFVMLRSRPQEPGAAAEPVAGGAATAAAPAGDQAPTLARRLRWIALAFVPSSLMLGVTSYITTDMAAIPLLWVIPLALYLLSFIIVFARVPATVHRAMVTLLPVAMLALVVVKIFQWQLAIGTLIELHLAAFFVAAMVCHGELAHDRPPSRFLTEFYLWMAVGGVCGGILNALIAPLAFDRILEYPLVLALVCLLGPGQSLTKASAAAPAPAAAMPAARKRPAAAKGATPAKAQGSGPRRWSPAWVAFGAFVGLIMFLQSLGGDPRSLLLSRRNFYGVHRVKFDSERNLIGLLHGSTVHGIQSRDPAHRNVPMTYFRHEGPIGQVFAALTGPYFKRDVAVMGLGIGTLASYVGAGQSMTYYELDPAIEHIASDTTYFTFLADARARGARMSVVLGDGRLGLGRSTDHYGLIVLDAFSSDVMPVHLVTREAFGMYLDHLDPDGVIAMNLSSRYFRLAPVLANIAHDAGLVCLFQNDQTVTPEQMRLGLASSQWMVMARRPEQLATLWYDRRWQKLEAPAGARVWTDDYSNFMSAVIWTEEAERHLRQAPGGFQR